MESNAQFIYKNNKLFDKKKLSDFLLEEVNNDLFDKVMELFAENNVGQDMFIVDAIRKSLNMLPLPDNCQSSKSERYISMLSKKYFLKNKNNFVNSDAVYMLIYTIFMLNTDIHSNKIKTKMTLDQFISMNSKINIGQDFSHDFFAKIYENVQTYNLCC